MRNQINRIRQCSYTCKDYKKMCTFYQEILELKKVYTTQYTQEIIQDFKNKGFICNKTLGDECSSYFEVVDNEYIILLDVQYNGENKSENSGFYHICLMVENIIQTARCLEKKGIQIWEGPSYDNPPYAGSYTTDKAQPCHSFVFFIQDPEGNEIEIMQFTKDSLQILNDHD